MSVATWSQTAATNASVDSAINFREGQSPGSVNNSIRAMMAEIAKWRDDLSGNVVTGGTATALTVTTNQVFASLTDGLMITVRMSVRNGAAATLNVDGLGAKAIATVYGTALAAGALPAGSIQTLTYDSTDDKWIAHNAREKVFSAGEYKFTQNATPDAGWLMSNGRTIGNASSNGTLRANADTEDLFTVLWNSCANAEAAIYDSAGSASTRGANAAADYAANKAIATINMAAAVPMGLDDLGIGDQGRISVLTPANGKIVGAETTVLVTANLPVTTPAGTVSAPTITVANGVNVVHATSTEGAQAGANSVSLPSGFTTISTITASSSTPSFTGTPFGSGTGHSNVQTSALGYWWVKL